MSCLRDRPRFAPHLAQQRENWIAPRTPVLLLLYIQRPDRHEQRGAQLRMRVEQLFEVGIHRIESAAGERKFSGEGSKMRRVKC